MKRILLLLMLFVCLGVSAQQPINYKDYTSRVKTEIKAKKALITSVKKSLKIDKNNVDLHKALVYANAELKVLEEKQKQVKEAKGLHDKLVKENKKYDEMKIRLLELKRQSEILDNQIQEIMNR